MSGSLISTPRILVGFLGRGVLLGILGSSLAAPIAVHVGYFLLASGLVTLGSSTARDDPSLALLPYSVPLGLVVGCAIGYWWSRSVSSEYRRWCIAVAGWAGLFAGAFPVSVWLVAGSLYAMGIGVIPGILTGIIWALAIAAFTLARHRSIEDAEQYQLSTRLLSVALMIVISPVALVVGWGLIFNQDAIGMLLGDFANGDFAGFVNIFFLLVGLSGAVAAWILTPLLTSWYVEEAKPSSPVYRSHDLLNGAEQA